MREGLPVFGYRLVPPPEGRILLRMNTQTDLEKPRMVDRMVLANHTVIGLQPISDVLSLAFVETPGVVFLKVAYPGNVQFNKITPETAHHLTDALDAWLETVVPDTDTAASA